MATEALYAIISLDTETLAAAERCARNSYGQPLDVHAAQRYAPKWNAFLAGMATFDFQLTATGAYSQRARTLGLSTFRAVCQYLLHLPYRRPKVVARDVAPVPVPLDYLAVLEQGCGTCSSKHGVLKALALEQAQDEVTLMLCFYNMTARNTPGIATALPTEFAAGIPEAHCYVRVGAEHIDVTQPGVSYDHIAADVLEEHPISLAALADKPRLHRAYLRALLQKQGHRLSFDAVWTVREACIAALSAA